MLGDTDPCGTESGKCIFALNNLKRNPQQAASAGVRIAPMMGSSLNHEGEDRRVSQSLVPIICKLFNEELKIQKMQDE